MIRLSISFAFVLFLLSSCTFFLGKKQDDTVDDIFEQGKIDPVLVPQGVGYVPVQPFFTGFSNPVDVYAGFDEMIYVIDDFGVHVLDQAGRRYRTVPIPGATDIVQDRRLHTFVIGRADIVNGGRTYNVAAVYHLTNMATAEGPYFLDTLLHPYSDNSRTFSSFRGADDEEVEYTALSILHDNTLLVSRTGPNNAAASLSYPDNTVLLFNAAGQNTGYSNGLSPNNPSIRSSYKISAMASYAGPPQRLSGISQSRDFFLAQYDSQQSVEFACIGIQYLFDPDFGSLYDGKPVFLDFDTSKADRFLYEPFRFGKIEDVYIAPDQNAYLFVVDSEKDSLFQFTSLGYEGVNAPANYPSGKQINVSFGGEGSGLFNFIDPTGVCYFKRMVYVADKGNGRICRYKLSTDLE
jgi:hypothetical protein